MAMWVGGWVVVVVVVVHGLQALTVWPSGLRRWLKAPVRKGVGSNPTAVTFPTTLLCGSTFYAITWFSPTVSMHSARTHRPCAGATGTCRPHTDFSPIRDIQDSLAEWSKALASGASPQGRGFEPHSCHSFAPGQHQASGTDLPVLMPTTCLHCRVGGWVW